MALVHRFVRQRLPEVKQAPARLRIWTECGKRNLKVGYALSLDLAFEPGLRRRRLDAFRRKDLAVAIAEQCDDDWPKTVDLPKADLENLALPHLFVSRVGSVQTPPQVDGFKALEALQKDLSHLRENTSLKIVALRLHVPERARDEYGSRSPRRIGFHRVTGRMLPSLARLSVLHNHGFQEFALGVSTALQTSRLNDSLHG